MATRLPPREQPEDRKLKLSRALQLAARNVQDRQTETAAAMLLLMSEEVAWWAGKVYIGHSLSKRDDGWLLVVRATERGSSMVAFAGGRTQGDAVRQFAYELAHDLLVWRKDKFRN